MMKKWVAIACALLMAAILVVGPLMDGPEAAVASYGEFNVDLARGRVSRVVLSQAATMEVELTDGTIYRTDNPRRETLKEDLLNRNIQVEETGATPAPNQIIGFLLGGLLVLGAYRLYSREKVSAAATMKEAERKESTVTFARVAGNPESVNNLMGLVDYLKEPAKYAALGARMPRGVLLYGPPGTGKTLMARALAGEAGVPFLYASGSDFVQMYVGMGAARVRDLFKRARKHGRCLIFIDEIDAMGRSRSNDGENGERDQTLNALLTEMSGFDPAEGILVVAATNRRDTLDEALLRPGRFDRHIEVGLPDRAAREKILSVVSQDMPLGDIDLEALAARTVGFSGAALESLMNEAAIRAAREERERIDNAHIDAAYKVCVVGEERPPLADERDRRITALHESGHALICRLLLPEDQIQHVTIIPGTNGSGGHMLRVPQERMPTKAALRASVAVALGGRAAEELIYGQEGVTIGASNDIEMATRLLGHMLCRLGMDEEVGLVSQDERAQGELIRRRMAQIYSMTLVLLEEHRQELTAITDALLEKETLSGEDIDRLMRENRLPYEQLCLAI